MIDWKGFARWYHKAQSRAGYEWLVEVFFLWDVEDDLDDMQKEVDQIDTDIMS